MTATIRTAVVFAVVFALAAALWFLSGAVSGTLLRFVIAAAMGLGIATFGIGFFRQMADAPPDPVPEAVPESLQLSFVCEMCGMELSVVKIAQAKAPRHCGEEMVLVSTR